jgi:hypothetical protein
MICERSLNQAHYALAIGIPRRKTMALATGEKPELNMKVF